MWRTALAILGIAAIASPAIGNWQFTRWGMSPAEVIAASPLPAQEYRDPNLDTTAETLEVITNYSAMGFDFAVMFKFSRRTHGLSRVVLMLKGTGSCGELGYELRRIYGEPDAVMPAGVRQWRDEKQGNVVALVPIGKCLVEYTEIPQGPTGL